MWTPGIKWGVQAQSYTHTTEFFGPVLGVMRAENLDHAIEMVNQTGYGLTSAIESLDRREQQHWKERIEAGNLYINRGTTGAVVLRQPECGVLYFITSYDTDGFKTQVLSCAGHCPGEAWRSDQVHLHSPSRPRYRLKATSLHR